MSVPDYLGALARVAAWTLPPDAETPDLLGETAHPRPRARFEPDADDVAGWPESDPAWAELSEEVEAGGAAAHPWTTPRREQTPAPSPSVPAPPRTTAETSSPVADAAPRPRGGPVGSATPEGGRHRDPPPVPAATPDPLVPEPDTRPATEPSLAAAPSAALAAVASRGPAGPVVGEHDPGAATPAATPLAAPRGSTDDMASPATLRAVAADADSEQAPRPTPAFPVDAAEPVDTHDPSDDPQVGGPVVVVEIGRIEVRLAVEPAAPPLPTTSRSPAPGPSLADYLLDRGSGDGRPA